MVGKKENVMDRPPIALQLYTVRDETARDFAGTLRQVAALGYRAVEFAGYGGLSASQMAALLDETRLRAASTHVGLAVLEGDLDRELDYCQTIGCSSMVLPWLPPERRGAESLRALAERLNEFGRRCHERGIAFGYHNHDFEFAQDAQGKALLDVLLENTDPLVVALELDVYWAAYAGVDPASYLRRHAGRALLIHVKDMAADRSFTEVGDGTLDMAGICRAARAQGTRWYIVENDQPKIPSLESAKRSLENLGPILQAL
jgi:sugar phosphate isomerase/epimerase